MDDPKMKLLTVTFYMKGGHQVVAKYAKNVKMTRDSGTGAYSGYEVEFEPGHHPSLFTVSIPDIVAVVAEEQPLQ